MKLCSGRRVGVAALVLAALVTPSTARAQPPANDDFAAALPIASGTGTVRATSAGATKEPGEPNHAGNPGGASVWYRWTAPTAGQIRFDTESSGFDTLLAVYQGSSVDALKLVRADDDSGRGLTSALSFRAAVGSDYYIAVDGFGGKAGRFEVKWQAAPENDDFAQATPIAETQGGISGSGSGATLESGEPWYEDDSETGSVWFRWTAPASFPRFTLDARGADAIDVYTGATLESLVPVETTGVYPSRSVIRVDVGTVYSIAVTASSDFLLSWQPPPANDDFAGAHLLVGLSGGASGSNVGATGEEGEPSAMDDVAYSSVWYRWRAPRSGGVRVTTNGSDFDTVLAVYVGDTLSALRRVAADDDGGTDASSAVAFAAVRGTVYSIAVDGWDGGWGRIALDWRWQPAPPNDHFRDARRIEGARGRVRGTNVGATTERGEPSHAGQRHASVWYRWTAPRSGRVALATYGSDFDTLLAVYRGSRLSALRRVAANDDGGEGVDSFVVFRAVRGTLYHVAVDGYGGRAGRIVLRWTRSERQTAASG